MTKPRLGVTIIIDNVSTPRSEADVAALNDAYDTAGFEVYIYRNCDSEVRYIFLSIGEPLANTTPSPLIQILHFHAVFWEKKKQNNRLSPTFVVGATFSGKS